MAVHTTPTEKRPGPAFLRAGPLRAFAYPHFVLLWGASIGSVSAFFMMNVARGWLVLEETDSAFMVTAVQAAGMVPLLLLSLVGGAAADRFNRRKILVATESFALLVLLALALLVMTGVVQVWHVFVLSFLHGTTFAMGMPTRTSSVPHLVGHRDIASGVAMFTTIFSAGQLVGPAIGGVLIDSIGIGPTFLVSSAVMVPVLLLLIPLRIPDVPRSGTAERISFVDSIKEGFVYVRGDKVMMGLMALGLVLTVFAMPYQSILPVFARDVLDAGADGLGWLMAFGGVGALMASLTVASMRNPNVIRYMMLIGATGFGLLVVLFSLSTVFFLSLGLSLVLGFFFQVFMTSNFTLVQIIVPDHIRGRVLSIRMIIFGLGPGGMLVLGAVAQVMGPVPATAGMGAIGLVLVLAVVSLVPSLRKRQVGVAAE